MLFAKCAGLESPCGSTLSLLWRLLIDLKGALPYLTPFHSSPPSVRISFDASSRRNSIRIHLLVQHLLAPLACPHPSHAAMRSLKTTYRDPWDMVMETPGWEMAQYQPPVVLYSASKPGSRSGSQDAFRVELRRSKISSSRRSFHRASPSYLCTNLAVDTYFRFFDLYRWKFVHQDVHLASNLTYGNSGASRFSTTNKKFPEDKLGLKRDLKWFQFQLQFLRPCFARCKTKRTEKGITKSKPFKWFSPVFSPRSLYLLHSLPTALIATHRVHQSMAASPGYISVSGSLSTLLHCVQRLSDSTRLPQHNFTLYTYS
ncbi:uncharacterized protein ARMOST_14425 [Armillaria ostoyae]|uniref:Uncharacterized protein n=1 Tax=Armillaria ostoyae TaxID=47428 RepID=A0A284RQK8_ARMOS|nr:uncharacterized protein ARMOST_14425 [Armillaria ostoyae]